MVKFLLPGSLPGSSSSTVEREYRLTYPMTDNLTGVAEMLGRETKLEEILWNFSRLKGKKRITLKQNPRFYDDLPRTKSEYSGDFENEPIENFWDATEIWVLTDDRSPVFLETENKKRAFGNFWVPAEAIIFKGPPLLYYFLMTRSDVPLDISGKLEGERIVAKDICGTPNLWHREVPTMPTMIPPVRRSATAPANPSDLPPIITNPVKGKMFEDWRLLVRDALDSPNISICISTKSTRPESQDNWVSRISPATLVRTNPASTGPILSYQSHPEFTNPSSPSDANWHFIWRNST